MKFTLSLEIKSNRDIEKAKKQAMSDMVEMYPNKKEFGKLKPHQAKEYEFFLGQLREQELN